MLDLRFLKLLKIISYFQTVAGTFIAYRCVDPAVLGTVATFLTEGTLKAALLAIGVGAFGAIVIIGIGVVTAY